MGLSGKIITISELEPLQIQRMFELLNLNFENASYEIFIHDLSEKDYAIILSDDGSGRIEGFSTQMVYSRIYQERQVYIIFSGDTIVDPQHRGSLQLHLLWGKLILNLQAECGCKPLYWFLISKGFRTYRFLPTYFKRYYPHCNCLATEWEAGLLRQIAREKFGGCFNLSTGLIDFGPHAQRLKQNLVRSDELRRGADPHINYFFQRNPRYHQGVELACLADCDPSNLKPFILKRLNRIHLEFNIAAIQ